MLVINRTQVSSNYPTPHTDYEAPATDGVRDEWAAQKLLELKNYTLPSKLDDTNLFRYALPMDTQLGLNPTGVIYHRQYLDHVSCRSVHQSSTRPQVTNIFIKNIKELVTEALRRQQVLSVAPRPQAPTPRTDRSRFKSARLSVVCNKD